jgi:hypothetical protein
MGWSYGIENGRHVGYGVRATCDLKGCKTKIDRGLGYVCGNMHGGGEFGCGRYFCSEHLTYIGYPKGQFCFECAEELEKRFPKENKEWNKRWNNLIGGKVNE